MVPALTSGRSLIAASKLEAVLVFFSVGGQSNFCFCWTPWFWTKILSFAVNGNIATCFLDNVLGELDVGAFGDDGRGLL